MASTVTFLQAAADTTDNSIYTFSAQNFGAAGAGRYIIATIVGRKVGGVATFNSVTIRGITATKVAEVSRQASNSNVVGIYIAPVPTGALGDVVVVFNAVMVRCGLALYSSLDLENAKPFDFDTSVLNDPAASIDVPADGFAIGIATAANSSAACTWTGLTEDFDNPIESGIRVSGASDDFVSAQTPLSILADFSANSGDCGVFASWPGVRTHRVHASDSLRGRVGADDSGLVRVGASDG